MIIKRIVRKLKSLTSTSYRRYREAWVVGAKFAGANLFNDNFTGVDVSTVVFSDKQIEDAIGLGFAKNLKAA